MWNSMFKGRDGDGNIDMNVSVHLNVKVNVNLNVSVHFNVNVKVNANAKYICFLLVCLLRHLLSLHFNKCRWTRSCGSSVVVVVL